MDSKQRPLAILLCFSLVATSGCTSMRQLPAADSSQEALPTGDPKELAASVRAAVKAGDRIEIVSDDGRRRERITVEGFDDEAIWGEGARGEIVTVSYEEIEALRIERFDTGKTVAAGVLATPVILIGGLILLLALSGGPFAPP